MRCGRAPATTGAQLLFLEHELDGLLEKKEIGGIDPIELEAVLVVPFDPTFELGTVGQNHDHCGAVLHLFEVVKTLGVCLFCGHLLAATARPGWEFIHHLIHRRSDQLTIRH